VNSTDAGSFNPFGGNRNPFQVSGMLPNSLEWQVPFVKCDSRGCEALQQDAATTVCEYYILAVAGTNSQ
jgi:hypothetical protein